jgi:hypothetical protein
MPREAAPDVVQQKGLPLKTRREDFCCLDLHGRHNSLAGVDGPIKSRKFANNVRAEA